MTNMPTPSPPPRSAPASSAAMDASPLSPLQTSRSPRSPHAVRSPHSHRRVRAFPREELWTWQGNDSGSVDPLTTKYDAIESALREAALTIPVTAPAAVVSGSLGKLAMTRTTSQTPANHHAHRLLHGSPSSLQHPATSSTPLASSAVSTPSSTSGSRNNEGSSSSIILPPQNGSKRRLGKKGSQSSLRGSTRNLLSPASSTLGREADGWKAYKLAARTNRLMVKTKKLIDVLHRNGGVGHKSRANRGDGGAEDETSDDSNRGSVTDLRTERELDTLEASEAMEKERITTERRQRQQLFEHAVGLDDGDVRPDNGHTWTKSFETRKSFGAASHSANNSAVNGGSDEVSTKNKNKPITTACGQYTTTCESKSLLVLPVLDLKRSSRYNPHTKTLRYDNYFFGDDRAQAFGGSLHLLPVPVDHLSMKNVGVTSSGSTSIVNGIKLRELQHLTFSENRIGAKGAMAIFKGFQDPHVHLKTLNLGNNQLGDQAVLVLMQSLIQRCTLEHLDLHKNNIYHSAKAIGELLRLITPLQSLNLSWNNIRGEPAQYLAKCMVENASLTSLDLSDNTLGNNGNADAELGACVANNKSLRFLDVSNNHIHGKSILVFVNSLQQNTTLERLTLRGNPIGNLGTEAILRSVASGAVATCEIDIGDCNVEIQDASQQTTIYGGGVYSLNLKERADAILLKELLLLNWKNKTEISDALWNGTPFTLNRKDEKAFVNTFPSSGVLQLKVQPNYDRHEEVIASAGLVRIEQLLQRSFGTGRDGDEAAKLLCIKLLAEEYSFHVDHANTLLALFQTHTSQVEKASAAAALIPQICDAKSSLSSARDELVYDCAAMEIPHEFFEDKDHDGKIDVCGDICMVIGLKNLSDVEQAHVEKRVGKWISFNVANPTGRYRLNMSHLVDRRILMRILETNRVEKKLRQHYKLADTSQHGLALQPLQGGFRNMRLNHVTVVMGPNWQFPRLGILEFDFVQTKRPYSICTALSDAAFDKFLREFKQLDVAADVKLIGLRSISTCYYFNCSQVQRLMEHFGTFERDLETGILNRAEVLIILFSRVVDEWNLGETLSLLDLATKQQVMDRLGHLHCFHPLQVAEEYGPLQLSTFDHRQLVLVLVKLASTGEIELRDVVLNNETVVKTDEWKTWTGEDKLPPTGVVSCSMRALQGMQSESQLPPSSVRKKMIQTLLLKLETRSDEQIA